MSILKKKLHANTLRHYSLPEDAQIKNIDPVCILKANRLDVVIRYLYVKSVIDQRPNPWTKNAYCKLIISQSSNFTKVELDPGKNNMDDYIDQFDDLIRSMQEKSFINDSAIPLCEGGIIDGAHRLACAIALNIKEIPTITLLGEPQNITYDDMQRWGVDKDILNEAARTYVHLKPNTRCAVLFPISANAHKEAIQTLSNSVSIDFTQTVPITKNGMIQLQHMLYGHHEWWSDKNAHDFATQRLKGSAPITFVFYQETEEIRPIKDSMRTHHNAGNHALHTTDTHEETADLANIVFNVNALLHLNNTLNIQTPIFDKLFEVYKTIASNDTCIDTGGVLAIHGLRDVNDLDYISWNNKALPKTAHDISLHKGEYEEIGLRSHEILYNPNYHFYYKGLKFASLNILSRLKKHRNTSKDLYDLSLIRYLKNKDNLVWSIIWGHIKYKAYYSIYLTYHRSFNGLVHALRKMLKPKTFEKIRNIYHKLTKRLGCR